MIKTRETDALLKQCKIKGRNPDPWKLCRKLERERGWARTMLWELYWIAYDLSRSANAYAEGYNDSEDKKRIKLARTALKNFDKKIKKEGERSRRHKNPET